MSSPLQLFTDFARELQKPHSFGDLLQLVAERCATLMDTPRATIRLLDPSGTRLLAVVRIEKLRKHGYRIALDDLGAGYAGLNSLALLQPDFVKLDMALIRGIHEKSSSRRLVKHLLEFCNGERIPVIAEGVETQAEHDMVVEIGCPFLQGNFLSPPGPAFPAVRS